MDYEALEHELVDKMNAYLAATPVSDAMEAPMLDTLFTARLMPEDADEFTRTEGKGYVNVHYSDSVYEKSKSTGQIVQDETVIVAFFLQCLKLRGEGGAHNLVKHVKKCFLGFKPTNGRRMYINSFGDWDTGDSSIKNPFFEFAFTTQSVQIKDEPGPIGGPLNQINVIPQDQ